MFMINDGKPDDVREDVTSNEAQPRLQPEIYSNTENMIPLDKRKKDYDADDNNRQESTSFHEEWSRDTTIPSDEAFTYGNQNSVDLEEEELEYSMDPFSSPWIKDIAHNEWQRFMVEKKRRSSAELSGNIFGHRVLYTESGEQYITRKGFRVHLVPIGEPEDEETVDKPDVSNYTFWLGVGILYLITLLCSELLYVEYGKIGYIPFGIVSLSIVYGVIYFICRADLPNFDPTKTNPQINEVPLMA